MWHIQILVQLTTLYPVQLSSGKGKLNYKDPFSNSLKNKICPSKQSVCATDFSIKCLRFSFLEVAATQGGSGISHGLQQLLEVHQKGKK